MKKFVLFTTLALAFTMLVPSNLSAQKNNKKGKIPLYKTIYPSSFFTINAEYLGGYRPDQTFNPQTPAFGFKAGTMRNVGWYLSAMTNFQFKGTFTTCEESEVVEGNTSSSYFDVLGGITLRYWKPLSFHLGLGYSYRSFNNETIYGQWAHVANHTAQGPAAALGFMFHLGGFVVSAEVLGSYNLQGFNISNYTVDKTRLTFGAKAGLGVCIPYNNRSLFNEQTTTTPAAPAEPVFYYQPTEKEKVVENVAAPAPAPAPQPTPEPAVKSDVLTVVTLPVSQLNPGGSITICGEVAVEGNEPVTERGICWGTTYYPSVTGPHTSDGSGKGYFTTVISDLQPGTLYYFRAYAGTQSGIRYGNTVSVSIPDAPKAPVAPVAPVAPTQPVQGTYNPPMPQPPVMPVPPVAPQQPIAPQPQMVPQQQEAPQQQAAPQQPEAPQQQAAPQDTTETQQTTVPEETTPQQPADNEENTETTNN